jgi:hypothetical protein
MLGIALENGLEVAGALVMLNRAVPNVDRAVHALFPHFTWVYRVHLFPHQQVNCPVCGRHDDHFVLLQNAVTDNLREYAEQAHNDIATLRLDIR